MAYVAVISFPSAGEAREGMHGESMGPKSSYFGCFLASSLEAFVHFYYSRGRETTATQAIFQQRYGFSLNHRASKDILLA